MIKIENIEIKGTETDCANINLVLGANNSGKSTFIRELNSGVSGAEIRNGSVWTDRIKLRFSNIKSEFDDLLPNVSDALNFQDVSDQTKLGLGTVYQATNWSQSAFNGIKERGDLEFQYEVISNPQRNAEFEYARFIIGLKTLIEDCSQRLVGPFNATINRIKDPFSNIVHFLNVKKELFDEISRHIKSVFGFGIVFDDLVQGEKEIRIEPRVQITEEEKKNPEKHIKYWEENSRGVGYQGDGIKAYLRICYALFNPAKNIILIDEPEAFLHPPQRRSLGQFISEHAKSGKQLFISTHDTEIVRGILNNVSRNNIKIFHLRNNNNNFSFVCSEGKDLSDSRHINESNLNSLFHKMTVLCEAEDDRMIYQYAAGKYFPEKVTDINFIGNNGKAETIKRLEFLRNLKLSVCCIFDVDALYSTEILSECLNLSDENRQFIRELINEVSTTLKIGKEDNRKNEFKDKGVEILTEELKQKALTVIEMLKSYGIYIIEKGCLESWTTIDKTEKKKIQIMLNKIDTEDVPELKNFMDGVINYQNTKYGTTS